MNDHSKTKFDKEYSTQWNKEKEALVRIIVFNKFFVSHVRMRVHYNTIRR